MDALSGRILSLRTGKGRRHDFYLWKSSGVRVHPDIILACDTGYQGMQKLHPKCLKPVRATKKRPLSNEQKQANRTINSKRIVVEHAIRRLKTFRILAERYRNRPKRFGLRLNLIAALTNFEL